METESFFLKEISWINKPETAEVDAIYVCSGSIKSVNTRGSKGKAKNNAYNDALT